MPSKLNTIRGLLARPLLLLAGVACSLAIGEILVRVFHLAPEVNRLEISKPYGKFVLSDNPILKYVPKAGTRGINSLGFRDREYSVAKRKDVFRIVVLGDSIPFGFCTDQESLAPESVFPKVIEERLNRDSPKPGLKYEVINLAVSGYDTQQEAEFLRVKGLQLEPDLVMITYCLNDAWEASAEIAAFQRQERVSKLAKAVPGVLAPIFHASALVRFVWQRVHVIQGRVAKKTSGQTAHGYEIPEAGISRIRSMGKEHGFSTILAIVPLFEDYRTYSWMADHQAIRALGEKADFTTIDLLEPFKKASGGDYRRLQGRCVREHPDEAGHQVIATEISRKILALPRR